MYIRAILTSSMLMVALTSAASSAYAQRASGMASCRTDLATFCQGVEAGGGKRIKCLSENQAKLSPDCAAVVQSRADQRVDRKADAKTESLPKPASPSTMPQPAASPGAQGKARMAACRADMASLCGNIQPGSGGRGKCLKENAAKVSPACAEAMSARAQAGAETKGAIKSACRDDSRRLCKDAVKGGGGRLACLQQNQSQLTQACAAVVSVLPQKKQASAPPAAPGVQSKP
jgi:hypothetical protein